MEANQQMMDNQTPKRFIEHPFEITDIPLSAKLATEAFDATLNEMLQISKRTEI